MVSTFLARVLLACGLCLLASPTFASIVIAATRVVYPADAADVTVRLTNRRATPALVEAWVEGPASREVPFAITPPLFRIEPGKGQALRVHRLPGAAFSRDRESLFWLNVLDIPADAPSTHGGNVLKMAVRSRLKLFVRPPGLQGRADRAPERVAWRLVGGALRIDNPTPFHVTVAHVRIDGHALRGAMVSPFGHLVLPLDDAHARSLRSQGRLTFGAINDAGGVEERDASLVRDGLP